MQYPKLVLAESNTISFPAAQHHRTDSAKLSLINAAAEEQLHQLHAVPGKKGSRKCRKGCQEDETAYHVATSCRATSYNARHDQVVYWLLRTILEATNAPYDIVKGLHFGKAVLNTEYEIPDGRLRIRAGQSILTEVPLHHNKPDVMVQIDTDPGPTNTTVRSLSSAPAKLPHTGGNKTGKVYEELYGRHKPSKLQDHK